MEQKDDAARLALSTRFLHTFSRASKKFTGEEQTLDRLIHQGPQWAGKMSKSLVCHAVSASWILR